MILVYMIALSVLVGYMRGGRLKHYLEKPLSCVFLPVAAFALEAAIPLAGARLLAPVVILEYVLLFAFVFANRKVPAVWLIAAGVALNALVIFANGFRMPVTPVAFDPAFGRFVERVRSGELIEYVLVGWDAPLWFLGDTIPISRVVPGIASVGDFVLAGGMFWLIQSFMTPPAKNASEA
jgi:ABC-type uncharacterized transport system permease subunit